MQTNRLSLRFACVLSFCGLILILGCFGWILQLLLDYICKQEFTFLNQFNWSELCSENVWTSNASVFWFAKQSLLIDCWAINWVNSRFIESWVSFTWLECWKHVEINARQHILVCFLPCDFLCVWTPRACFTCYMRDGQLISGQFPLSGPSYQQLRGKRSARWADFIPTIFYLLRSSCL